MPRQRGLIVSRLNPDTLLEQVRAVAPQWARHHLSLPFPLYLLETEAVFAVVSSQGVGYRSTDGGVTCRVLVDEGVVLTNAALRCDRIRLAETAERLDLADAIDTFGDRLDDNHWLWWQTAQLAAVPTPHEERG